MAKYGVYVYGSVKIWGGVCPKVNNRKVILNLNIDNSLIIHRKVTCCQASLKQTQIEVWVGYIIYSLMGIQN